MPAPPPRRELLPRDREDLARGFARDAVDFLAVDLRALLLRAGPADEDFARVVLAFFAVARFAVLHLAVERLAVERLAVDLRAPLLRVEPDDDPELEPELALALPSIDHLPVITRCAASATASAISDPSLVALAITLLAAWDAVSAASRPASRIARRAFGLALIAAAAAARPAASISLLIAALASLSTVSLLLLFAEEREELLRADLAMLHLLRSRKDTSRL